MTIGDFIQINKIGNDVFQSVSVSNAFLKMVIESNNKKKNRCMHFFDILDGKWTGLVRTKEKNSQMSRLMDGTW